MATQIDPELKADLGRAARIVGAGVGMLLVQHGWLSKEDSAIIGNVIAGLLIWAGVFFMGKRSWRKALYSLPPLR